MDEQLNHAPAGFLTLSAEGTILSVNETLLQLLEYEFDQLAEQPINFILSTPARMFYQFYFVPLIKTGKPVEEMYISLKSSKEEEIPVLINALQRKKKDRTVIECVLLPMHKRNEYENELLVARKKAEAALTAKNKANSKLETALKKLKAKQDELLELNKQNQKYKTETKKELQLAKKIQETLLTEPIANEDLQVEAYYEASSELSGDMYGCYQISQHQYGIIILDVMGHGISSSLITMSLHSLFQRLIPNGIRPNTVIQELDNHLHNLFHNNAEAWHYCTATYLLVDTDKQEIEYINAGHPPALWEGADGEQDELRSTAPPIGAFEGISFKTNTFRYTKGSRLLLYTDGVVDPFDSHQLRSLLTENVNFPLTKLKSNILRFIKNEENAYHENDDQCFILVEFK